MVQGRRVMTVTTMLCCCNALSVLQGLLPCCAHTVSGYVGVAIVCHIRIRTRLSRVHVCRPLQTAFSGPLPPPPPMPPPPTASAPSPLQQQPVASPGAATSPLNAELARRAAEHLRAATAPEQGQLLLLPEPPSMAEIRSSPQILRPDLKRKWDLRADSPADDLPPGEPVLHWQTWSWSRRASRAVLPALASRGAVAFRGSACHLTVAPRVSCFLHTGFGGTPASEKLSVRPASAVMPAAPLESRLAPEASPMDGVSYGANTCPHLSRVPAEILHRDCCSLTAASCGHGVDSAQLALLFADGPKSLDLESQFAVGMLGSRASLPSNGELSPVVHLATANGGPPAATANGHAHSNGGLDLRQPPSYAADGGRASPAPSLPPPLPPANPFAEQALSPVMTSSAGMDQQHAGDHHNGLRNGQQRQVNAVAESTQLEGSRSAPVDFLNGQSSSAPRDDGTTSWPEPDAAFQVSRRAGA